MVREAPSVNTVDPSTLGATGWQLPDEYVMLRDTVRRFMADEVKSVEDKLPHDSIAPSEDALARLRNHARKLGLWMVQSPAEYGGAGLDLLGQCRA